MNFPKILAITDFFGPIFLRPKLRDPRPEEVIQINAITCFMIDNCHSILPIKAHKQQYEEEKNMNSLRASRMREERIHSSADLLCICFFECILLIAIVHKTVEVVEGPAENGEEQK
jgi:hypothetical protein